MQGSFQPVESSLASHPAGSTASISCSACVQATICREEDVGRHLGEIMLDIGRCDLAIDDAIFQLNWNIVSVMLDDGMKTRLSNLYP